MSEPVKRRRYSSRLRSEQAADTRRRILTAAQELFERDGYVPTTMAGIATGAGVSLKTVYLAFETKSGLLRALWHLRLRGDQDSVAVGEQPWFKQVLAEPNPERQLRLNLRNATHVRARLIRLVEAIRTAAPSDPEVAALWESIGTQFHHNQRDVVASIANKGALSARYDVAGAADVLWAVNHPSTYALLVLERGWTPERYERWAGDLLCAELLKPDH